MLNQLIGNTPMIKIKYKYNNKISEVYTKLEYYNLTGSIKDRVAYYMIKEAKNQNILKDKMPLIEATSGNTGISIAALGAYYKHPVYIFMPNWVSKERQNILKMYGANLTLISKEEGGFIKCIEEAEKLSKQINGYLTNQFKNEANIKAHYETTGTEIINKITPDIFVSGIGTGGTLIGIGKKLKEKNNKCEIYALEPDTMSLIKTKTIKSHKIDGIGDEFIPEIVDLDMIKDVVLIKDDDAINMSRKLGKELGLGVGISSGANLLAAIILNNQPNKKVVTVFPDDSKKYLTTDLSKEIDLNESFISNKIELINYEIL